MEKIAIVTDSSSSLDFIKHESEHLYMLRMPIHFKDKEYLDGLTITVDEFYQKIATDDVIPSTSQPSLGEALELYERLKKIGYTDIIHLPISKGISGHYQSLFSIRNLVEGINIHILDTNSTAVILGYIVLEALKMVKSQKGVTEIIAYSEYLSMNYKAYFVVDDLRYLIKNGRLSNAAGFIGNFLKIKPLLTFNDLGEIIGIEKIRTTKKAIQHIIEMVMEETQGLKVQYFIAYGHDEALIAEFKANVAEVIDLNDVIESIMPSVIGAHVGSGVIALGYFKLKE